MDRITKMTFPEGYVSQHRDNILSLANMIGRKKPGLKAGFPADAHERAQHREHERLRRFGMRVEVVDSYEGVDALFVTTAGEID